MSDMIQFPVEDRQVDRFVKSFRSGFAEGMASGGLDAATIRRALDALEPDIRLVGESLVIDHVPETVWDYQKAVIDKAKVVLGERLRAYLERVV